MHGIQIFWKKSRIFKVVAVIVSVPVLFIALLLLPALPVEASSYIPSSAGDFNFIELGVSNARQLSYNIKPTGVIDEQNQYYNLDYDTATDTYSLSVVPNSARLFVQYEGNITVRSSFTGSETSSGYNTAMLWGSENFTLSISGWNSSYSNLIRAHVNYIEATSNYNLSMAPRVYNQHDTDFSVTNYIGCSYSPWFTTCEVIYTIGVTIFVESTAFSDVPGAQHVMLNNHCNVALSGSSSYDVHMAVSTYSFYEILNTLDAKLYNVWVADNLIYDQLRLNGDSNNFANIVNSELIRDAAQAHADAQNLDNHLMNDSSGWSGSTNNFNSEVQAAQSAADSAVDNAVHNYSVELAEVSDYDAVGFFRDQALASTFWRDIGEYILNRNNLGYFAVGLVVVTIIGLFVFLLRL